MTNDEAVAQADAIIATQAKVLNEIRQLKAKGDAVDPRLAERLATIAQQGIEADGLNDDTDSTDPGPTVPVDPEGEDQSGVGQQQG